MRGIGMEGSQENRTSRDEWLRTPGTGGMRPSLMAAENQKRIRRESWRPARQRTSLRGTLQELRQMSLNRSRRVARARSGGRVAREEELRDLNRVERRTLANLIATDKERGASISRDARIHTNAADQYIVAACRIERFRKSIGRAIIDDAHARSRSEQRADFRFTRCACELEMNRFRMRA